MQRHPLVQALTEFNAAMLSELDADEVLQRLCDAAVELLPIVGAGIAQIEDGGLKATHASDDRVRRLADEQAVLGEGPSLSAMHDQQRYSADLGVDAQRWPGYSQAAVVAGVGHVTVVPLSSRGRVWGLLDLYSGADPLSDGDADVAQVLADAAVVCVDSVRRRRVSVMAEERLRRQLLHDPLTGLPNRVLLLDRLSHALLAISRKSRSLAAFFVDLDGFKAVNDRYGHRAGDLLLKVVTERLTSTLRPTDTLARLSGDEFVIVCEDLHVRSPTADHDLMAVGQRILDVLRDPVYLDGIDVVIHASVGAVWANDTDDSAEAVLNDADRAMYEAKRAGGDRVAVTDRSPDSTLASTIRTEIGLYQALGRNEMRLHYQPIVPFTHDGPEGAEALLRWQHSDRGLLLPADFLAAAERTGLILPIGLWALEEACVALKEAYPDGSQMSVNVSALQLRGGNFAADVAGALERTGIGAERLILEITEAVLATGHNVMSEALRELVTLGVDIAIDDFGTGYSSFAYLKQLPATILKIDRFFVAGLGKDPRDLAIVRGITTMAHELGLRVIAEGAESEQQRDLLISAGCDAAQGWILGRPKAR